MKKAIEDRLKTGSITRVYPKGDVVSNIQPPYIIIGGPVLVPQPGNEDRGKNQYTIYVHFQRGYVDQLDDYIYIELVSLLHKQRLTMRDGRKATLHISGAPSDLIEGNDDGTISKERIFITAAIYS